MKGREFRLQPGAQAQSAEQKTRLPVVFAILGGGLVCVTLVVVVARLGKPADLRIDVRPPAAQSATVESGAIASESAPVATVSQAKPATAQPPRIPLPARLTSSANSSALVNGVWQLDPALSAMTPEHAAQWKRNLEQLVQSGAASVPAIAEFLATDQDNRFSAQDRRLLGYDSASLALFDALAKIGGTEAQEVLAATLRRTGEAGEIRALAAHLEGLAPGQYKADILAAALDTIALTKTGKLPSADIGPVFDVLREYGDGSVAANLEASRREWSHYASIALAGLPDGAGIPSLLEVVQGESKQKPAEYLFSFQLLAQAASTHESAASGLLDLVRGNKIPAQAWLQIVEGLLATDAYQYGMPRIQNTSGYSKHKVNGGEQVFYSPPLVAGQDTQLIQARLGFVDQLLGVTSDPTAREMLDQARMKLKGKLGSP